MKDLTNRFSRSLIFLDLCKVKLSAAVSLSAMTGYFLQMQGTQDSIVTMTAGVFLLASGCSALNQYQERYIDARMPRTMNRPIPSGRMKPVHAAFTSIFLICFGLLLLHYAGKNRAFLLGCTAVFLYNGLYTYLKTKTPFAVLPGAIIGTIAPAIGWVSAGGELASVRLAILCCFFFLWQMPHFWLLILKYGGEYEGAGLPSLSNIFSRSQIVRIIFQWIFATAVCCQMISIFGAGSNVTRVCLLVLTVLYIALGVKVVRGNPDSLQPAFARMNSYMIAVLLFLLADRVVTVLPQVERTFLLHF